MGNSVALPRSDSLSRPLPVQRILDSQRSDVGAVELPRNIAITDGVRLPFFVLPDSISIFSEGYQVRVVCFLCIKSPCKLQVALDGSVRVTEIRGSSSEFEAYFENWDRRGSRIEFRFTAVDNDKSDIEDVCTVVCIEGDVSHVRLVNVSQTLRRVGCAPVNVKRVFGASGSTPGLNESLNHPSSCAICLTNEANMLCLPCRHLCMCSSCVHGVVASGRKCPICRGSIKQFLALNKPVESSITHI